MKKVKKMIITKSCSFCEYETKGYCIPAEHVFKNEILIHVRTEKKKDKIKYIVKRDRLWVDSDEFVYCGKFWERAKARKATGSLSPSLSKGD